MKEITQEQMDRLFRAAELARKPGACQYEDACEPCCVIAQLAVLEAPDVVTVAVLRRWDDPGDGTEGGNTIDAVEHYAVDVLDAYDRNLLSLVQEEWDTKARGYLPEVARENVRRAIRDNYAVRAP